MRLPLIFACVLVAHCRLNLVARLTDHSVTDYPDFSFQLIYLRFLSSFLFFFFNEKSCSPALIIEISYH